MQKVAHYYSKVGTLVIKDKNVTFLLTVEYMLQCHLQIYIKNCSKLDKVFSLRFRVCY